MVNKNKIIEIRPIPNRNNIKKFSENLEHFSSSKVIAPYVNPVTLKYETGLDKKDIQYLKENKFPYDLSNNYIRGTIHPFWGSQIIKVELKNKPIFLKPGKNLIDFVKWKYLLVNTYIYKSETEMLSGSKPQATHYIYNESEEISIKANKLEKRNNLIKDIGNLSLKRKRDIILIIENEDTENKNENYLTVKFDQIINDKNKIEQLELLLNSKVEDVSLSAQIKSAIRKNVLRRTKKGIFYFETNLGFTEKDVLEFLNKPDNQEILIKIQSNI